MVIFGQILIENHIWIIINGKLKVFEKIFVFYILFAGIFEKKVIFDNSLDCNTTQLSDSIEK